MSKLDLSKVPQDLQEKALERIDNLVYSIQVQNFSLSQDDFTTVGFNKQRGITVTCRVNQKYGCIVCEKKHETMQFRLR